MRRAPKQLSPKEWRAGMKASRKESKGLRSVKKLGGHRVEGGLSGGVNFGRPIYTRISVGGVMHRQRPLTWGVPEAIRLIDWRVLQLVQGRDSPTRVRLRYDSLSDRILLRG